MDYSIRKKIEDVAENKYKAVILASKLARKINNRRFAAIEQLGPDAPLPTFKHKVTTEAILELAEGKVNYSTKLEDISEDQIFPE